MFVGEGESNTPLIRAIVKSEGLNSEDKRTKGYLPLYRHPLPVSENRHNHEKVLRKVLSCKIPFQAMAAITLGDAWTLEEVYMRSGREALGWKNGASPLHLAVQMKNVDAVMVLINIGVDVNALNGLGFTPLFLAHSANSDPIMKILRENGAIMFVDSNEDAPSTTCLEVYPEVRNKQVLKKPLVNDFLGLPRNSKLY